MNRRKFLQHSGLGVGMGALRGFAAVTADPADRVASAAPVQWAMREVQAALDERKLSGRRVIARGGLAGPPESLSLTAEQNALVASGSDTRGLVYALLEVADRVRCTGSLNLTQPFTEKPANAIRSISRCFESDVEDKSWFHDRAMWRAYLTMLAAHRYNRFNLTFGLGYNAPRAVTDVYFYFPYPFLLAIPGYNVRAVGLSDAERDRNMETLKFITEETAARGLRFQLGLWTHAYQWPESPKANYTISGLNADNHAPYCRDALAALLKACPAIAGLTFRIHGESGIPEGNYSFWQTVFDGVVKAGRRIEIDMHAKGMDQKTLDVALATGMPVNCSAKYWAEHMGMPYHQASIRELERAPEQPVTSGPYTLSNGSRRFTRYGYGDLLPEDRKWGILHRIWPGTQRVLLWGDPVFAAGYGRASSFCGSAGVEWMEPLSFKGRGGSGLPGGRCAYADKSLEPKYDWEKYVYQYRVWGRLIYNPDAHPDGWRRQLRHDFGASAQPAEEALASASRILPVITTTHGASGSNNAYWPEMYTNMPIVDAKRNRTYRDTPQPGRFGMVSSFDPQLFSSIEEFARHPEDAGAKYSPVEVAQWLEELADQAGRSLSRIQSPRDPALRRLTTDVAIQIGIGRFFAWKIRAAVLWTMGSAEALPAYRKARQAWAELSEKAKVYVADVSYGSTPHLRGHWRDRLPDIDADIADMERAALSGAASLPKPQRPRLSCRHTPAARFRPGEPHEVALSFAQPDGRTVLLHYRRVNQAERWQSSEMQWRDAAYRAQIPAAYTRSPFALQYYFEVRQGKEKNIFPGFHPDLTGQPYFLVRSS